MSLQDKHISGSILKKIRTDLSLKQKDLKCEGIQNISRLENGESQMSYTIAKRLCKKINEIITDKHIILDYEVTEELLMGRTSILRDDVLYKLKSCEDEENAFEEINQIISNLNGDEAVEFIVDVLNVLSNDIYKYSDYVCNYCYKAVNYSLSPISKIDIFNHLIKAYFVQNQFIAVIGLGKSLISDVIKSGTVNQKEKFFGNIANAYIQVEEYENCYKTLRLVSSFTSKETELYFLFLRAVSKVKMNDIFGATKAYEEIINKASKINNYNYIANSYSNIGDLYLDRDLDMARKNINKSIELIDKCDNLKFILNCYYNKFLLSLKENNFDSIDCFLEKSIKLAVKLNDNIIKDKLINNMVEYYIVNNSEYNILDFIKKIIERHKVELETDSFQFCIKHIKDEKIIYKIIKIAQKQ